MQNLKIKTKKLLFVFCLVLSLLTSDFCLLSSEKEGGIAFAGNLDEKLADLSEQITNSMTEAYKTKIAVIEFSDLDGNITNFGKYLSEELITRLFMTKKFEVVERQLLNKIMAEHTLSLTGLVDPDSAKELGKILGVDAICSGTVTDLGTSVKVNARLIATETGTIFAVASVEIFKDETVIKLMGEVISAAPTGKLPAKKLEKKPTGKAGEIFFEEDFSEVEAGMIPEGWIGGEKLMVKSDGRQKFLTNFEKVDQKFTVDNVKFPKNFKFEWVIFVMGGEDHHVNIGNLPISIAIGNYGKGMYPKMAESRKEIGGNYKDKTMKISLEKRGDVFRLLVDGNEAILARYPDFKIPTSFSFELESGFKLYKIIGTDLGD